MFDKQFGTNLSVFFRVLLYLFLWSVDNDAVAVHVCGVQAVVQLVHCQLVFFLFLLCYWRFTFLVLFLQQLFLLQLFALLGLLSLFKTKQIR